MMPFLRKDLFKTLFHSGNNERNRMLRNNILFSGMLKIIGLITSLLIVPITINYLNNEVYGIWMTITSILFWINTFDIGLGNGMRNYLTVALSKNDYQLGRAYISTTFLLLGIIALAIALILLIPLLTLDFNKVFNTMSVDNIELRNVLFVAIAFTLANFVLKNIGYIFVALQKYAINDLLNISGNVIALFVIYILTQVTTGSLLYVVLAYTATYTIIYIIASVPIFRRYQELKPSLRYFDKRLSRRIINKGVGFFIIQITSCLVIFGAANLFITQFCGPSDVTIYNVAYKYFNLIVIAYTIVLSPMWNAYTDAYVKGDMSWISNTFKRALNLWGLSVVGGIFMLVLSNLFYYLWVGETVSVPFSVSLSVLIYISFFNLNNCVTYLINGLNKIRIQIMTSLTITILYIVIVFFSGKKLGIEGVVLSMAASYAFMSIVHIYQCKLLIRQKAKGIWNK